MKKKTMLLLISILTTNVLLFTSCSNNTNSAAANSSNNENSAVLESTTTTNEKESSEEEITQNETIEKEDQQEINNTDNNKESQSDENNTQEDPIKTEVNDSNKDTAETSAEPASSTYKLTDKKDEKTSGNFEYNITYPEISGMSDETIQEKINTILKDKSSLGEDTEEIDSDYKESHTVIYETKQKTDDILSLEIIFSVYFEGAAHPNYATEAITIDMKTGEEIKLDDLFKTDIDYKTPINKILNEKVNELDYELFGDFEGLEENQGFYLTDSSIVFFYSEGVYTPHAVGTLYLEVGFDEINDLLK